MILLTLAAVDLLEQQICSDGATYRSYMLGRCIECGATEQFFNGSCYNLCPGQVLALGGGCATCVGCTADPYAACLNKYEYVLETDTGIQCVQLPKEDANTVAIGPSRTCLATETFSAALNKCVSTGLTVDVLCENGDIEACNYMYITCLKDDTKCAAYDALLTTLKMPRNVDLQAYAELNFTAKLGPNEYSSSEPNVELQEAYTGELFLILYDRHGAELYNDKFFEGGLSLCQIFRGIENTRTTYYGANKLNVNDTEFSSFSNASSYEFLTKPVTFSRIVEAGTGFEEKCSLPGRQIYDYIKNNELYAAVYSEDENEDLNPVPIVSSRRRIYFKEKSGVERRLDLSTESLFPLFYPIDAIGNYSLATLIYIDFEMDFSIEKAKLPVLRVTSSNFSAPLFSLNYIRDNSPETGYFQTFGVESSDRPQVIFKASWLPVKQNEPIALIVCGSVMGALGIIYGYFAAEKYAGVSGKFISTKIVHRYAVSGDLRSVEEVEKNDYMPIIILIMYVIGFLGIGFVFSGLFYALAFMERPISYIEFSAARENCFEYCAAGVVLSLVFYVFRSILEARKLVIFFHHDNTDDPHSIAWRAALCLNSFSKVQRASPISNVTTLSLLMVCLFAGDLLYMGNASRNWTFGPYSEDPFAESLSLTLIYLGISLLQALLNYAIHSFFPSEFLKFQNFLPTIGLSAAIFDTPKSLLLINGKDGVLDNAGTQDYGIADIMTYSVQLAAKYIRGPKYGENSSQILRCFYGEQNMLFLVYSEMSKIIALRAFSKKDADHVFSRKLFGFLDYDVQYETNENSVLLESIQRQEFAVMESALASNAQLIAQPRPVGLIQQFNDFGDWQPNSDVFINYQRATPSIDYLEDNPLFKSLFSYRLWLYEITICAGGMLVLDYYLRNWAIAIFIPILTVYIIKRITNVVIDRRNSLINGINEDWTGFF